MTIGSEEFTQISVLSYLEQLQSLRRLDMQHTGVNDATFHGLTSLTQLTHLHVHNASLSGTVIVSVYGLVLAYSKGEGQGIKREQFLKQGELIVRTFLSASCASTLVAASQK